MYQQNIPFIQVVFFNLVVTKLKNNKNTIFTQNNTNIILNEQ